MLDGRTGKVLWQLNATASQGASDLVIRTAENHRDAFVFRVKGVSEPVNIAVRKSKTVATLPANNSVPFILLIRRLLCGTSNFTLEASMFFLDYNMFRVLLREVAHAASIV